MSADTRDRAHVHAYGQDAPAAAGIIHLGGTSCFVTDNTELIFIQKGLKLLLPRLAKVISNLSQFALKYKDMPTLAYTHYQAAQPHTVGKRAAQWTQDLLLDLRNLTRALEDLEFRGTPYDGPGGILHTLRARPATNTTNRRHGYDWNPGILHGDLPRGRRQD